MSTPRASAPSTPAANNTPVAAATTRTPAARKNHPRRAIQNPTATRASVSATTAIADATAVSPHEVLIDGKGPGTVSLIIWGPDRYRQYDVVVDQGTVAIEQQLHLLFPGEDIQVSASEEALVLHGRVSSNEVSLRAAEIAAAAAPKAKVINMFELPGGSASQQVMLQVRVAEVNRRAVREVGMSFFTGATGSHGYIGRTSTEVATRAS